LLKVLSAFKQIFIHLRSFFFEIAANGATPFGGECSKYLAASKIINGDFPEAPGNTDLDIFNFAKNCTSHIPEKRLSLEEIYNEIKNFDLPNESAQTAKEIPIRKGNKIEFSKPNNF